MNLSTVKNGLYLASNIAMLLVAVLAIFFFARSFYLSKNTASARSLLKQPAVLTGIHGIEFSKSPKTIVMFLSTNCVHCNNSASFYQKISTLEAKTPGRSSLVAVFSEPEIEGAHYLEEHSLPLPAIGSVNFEAFGVSGTPTLVSTDKQGNVLHAWIGELSAKMQNEVLTELGFPSDETSKHPNYAPAVVQATYNLFDEDNALLTIRPETKSENDVLKYVREFDVDGQGFVYLGEPTAIARYDRDGNRVGVLNLASDKIGPFCVDGAGNVYVAARGLLNVYSPLLHEIVSSGRSLPIPKDSIVLRLEYDRANAYLYLQAYSPEPLSQILYRINPQTMDVVRLYQVDKPVQFSPGYSPGAFAFAVSSKYVYVSDIYEYKVRIYSSTNGSLVKTFSAHYKPQAVSDADGNEKNLKMIIGNLTGPGSLKLYSPIFHLTCTDDGRVLVWTSQRSQDSRQVVNVYDEGMKLMGVDLRYMDPGLSNYKFINRKVFAQGFEFANERARAWISPLDLPGKPFSLKVFKELSSGTARR
jgi:hypothetical protein